MPLWWHETMKVQLKFEATQNLYEVNSCFYHIFKAATKHKLSNQGWNSKISRFKTDSNEKMSWGSHNWPKNEVNLFFMRIPAFPSAPHQCSSNDSYCNRFYSLILPKSTTRFWSNLKNYKKRLTIYGPFS